MYVVSPTVLRDHDRSYKMWYYGQPNNTVFHARSRFGAERPAPAKYLSLAPGDSERVSFPWQPDHPGEYTITITIEEGIPDSPDQSPLTISKQITVAGPSAHYRFDTDSGGQAQDSSGFDE